MTGSPINLKDNLRYLWTIWNMSNWNHRSLWDCSGRVCLGRRAEINYRLLENSLSRGRKKNKKKRKRGKGEPRIMFYKMALQEAEEEHLYSTIFLPNFDAYWFQTVFQVWVIQLVFVKCRNNPVKSEIY